MSWLRHCVTTPEVASLGMMPPNAVSTAPHWALCLQMGRHRRGRGEVTEWCSHLLVFSLHADWFPAVPSSSGHDAEFRVRAPEQLWHRGDIWETDENHGETRKGSWWRFCTQLNLNGPKRNGRIQSKADTVNGPQTMDLLSFLHSFLGTEHYTLFCFYINYWFFIEDVSKKMQT